MFFTKIFVYIQMVNIIKKTKKSFEKKHVKDIKIFLKKRNTMAKKSPRHI